MSPEVSSPITRRHPLLPLIEAVGVFLLGVAVMNFLYAHSASRPGGEIGVPAHDSFYHVAMASMLPEHGAMGTFPWLQYTWFRDQGDGFVSHHWGFHLLLLPFVKAGEWLRGDALAGGRWAMSAFFGVNLLLFHLLLRQRRVPLHWLWIALFLLLPDQFFARHGYVRAIGSSLMFMQLILLAMFAERLWAAALAVGAYVHLYLGAVFFGPLIVAFHALSNIIAPREERRFPWRLVLITAGGWALGVVTYPYSAGMYEFLKMQVFGSGLSPDIEVGREWKPYTDAWFLVKMAAPLLCVWVAALLLRVRMGPRLDARETTLMLLQFLFLLLTFKARRFIEYWPAFSLLSAAYLAAPPLRVILAELGEAWARRTHTMRTTLTAAGLLGGAAACGLLWMAASRTTGVEALASEWRIWAVLVAFLALPALASTWCAGTSRDRTTGRIAILGGGAAMILTIAVASMWIPSAPPRMQIPGFVWGLLVLAYGLVPLILAQATSTEAIRTPRALVQTSAIVLAAIALPLATFAIGAKSLASASSQLRCYYDLEDTRALMAFLKRDARPGDVVFTDDWDIFPVFFYHNRHNHYIVGLDPKFTHQRNPDLWNRYVRISRGEVPATIRLASSQERAIEAPVALQDIRREFKARYVVADRDHTRLADALANAPALAEFVYPGDDYAVAKRRQSEYVVFRIRSEEQEAVFVAASNAARDVSQGPVALSDLIPSVAKQGWGALALDKSVDGRAIRLAGERFTRGVGTHAPHKLVYSVPSGAAFFEASVGIDDETEGEGSARVFIYVDGVLKYESPQLIGGGAPAVVRIPVNGHTQIELRADATSDGQQFDHVCWGNARFTAGDLGATALAPAPGSTAMENIE